MTKYKQAVEEMIARHRSDFDEFKVIHDKYTLDDVRWKEKFDELGRPILRLVEEEENRLCRKMESSGKSAYSTNLAEKFREEVRKYLPLIDLVGVQIERTE